MTRRRRALGAAGDAEPSSLNIVPMLDVVTIILVFLLKSVGESAAAVPQNDDLRLPPSLARAPTAEEGVVVTVSKSQILVGDTRVLELPGRATVIRTGAGSTHKRGPNELYIVPLGTALRSAREADLELRRARGLPLGESQAIVVADETTPYRLFSEVLFTLGQQSFGKFHLVVLQGAH